MNKRRKVSYKELKLYSKVQDEGMLHLLYGTGIFVLIFIAFNIELWDNGKFGLFTIVEVFIATLKYFFLAGIPVYFSFFLFHRRKLHISALNYLFKKEIANGMVYPGFITFVAIASCFFTFPLHYLYKDLGILKILSPHWYGTFLAIFLMVILLSGADDYRKALADRPRHPKPKTKPEKSELKSLLLDDKKGNKIKVNISDIRYVKGDGNDQLFYLNAEPYGKKVLYSLRVPLKNYVELLPKSDFLQCHRSNIVNKNYVIGFTPGLEELLMRNPNNDMENEEVKEEKVSIGDKFKESVKEFFKEFLSNV